MNIHIFDQKDKSDSNLRLKSEKGNRIWTHRVPGDLEPLFESGLCFFICNTNGLN